MYNVNCSSRVPWIIDIYIMIFNKSKISRISISHFNTLIIGYNFSFWKVVISQLKYRTKNLEYIYRVIMNGMRSKEMFMHVNLHIYWPCLSFDNHICFKHFWDHDWGIKSGSEKCIATNALEDEFNLEYLNLLQTLRISGRV